MKNLIFLILTMLCLSAFGQRDIRAELDVYGNHFFDEVAQRTGGYCVIPPDIDMGSQMISTAIRLPPYYSFDLLRMELSSMLISNRELIIFEGWQPYMHGHTYTLMFRNIYLLAFFYVPESRALIITFAYT